MGNEKGLFQVLDNVIFPKIFQTFRIAVYRNNLIIAFLAVAVICSAGRLMDLIFVAASGSEDKVGVFSTLWYTASAGFHGAVHSLLLLDLPSVKTNIVGCLKLTAETVSDHYVYYAIFALIKLAVISVAGGAICRIAALQFARGEKPGLTESLRFSTRRFTSFFTTPLAPIAIVAFIGLFIFLLGLIGNIPYAGQLIMGIFLLLALIAGILMAVVLIGTAAGFNLMFPAVAHDGSDCFDAISRSFSYVYSKPWRMGFYTVVAVAYGAVCYMFVRFFAFLSLRATYWFLQLGVLGDNSKLVAIWQKPSFGSFRVPPDWQQLIWSEQVAAFLIYLCVLAVVGLVVSFIISFYFSANTIIYSLMRNRVDNTAFEDIYVEEVTAEPTVPESADEEAESQSEPDPPSSAEQ